MQRFLPLVGKLALSLVLLGAIGAGYYWYQQVHAPCVAPISYTIGQLDSRFWVSKADFLGDIKEAAFVWSTVAGKPLFLYDANGTLPINLIYDAREATTQKNQTLETNISSGKVMADSVKQQFTTLKAEYESNQNTYQVLLAAYNQNLYAYNQEVSYWNQKGGAPKSEYEKLQNKKNTLDMERIQLERVRVAVNTEAAQVNALIDQYNIVVNHVNATVSQVNQTAGREFEEGEYVSDSSGKRITIYEFQNRDKLVRVLAHELGHALGLDHNANPNSIMYYLNQSTNSSPSADDIAALKALCQEAIPVR